MGGSIARFGFARRKGRFIALAATVAMVTLILPLGRNQTMPAPQRQSTRMGEQQLQLPDNEPEEQVSHKWERKQKKELLKSNFEKMQQDARELVELAKSLEDDLNKSNENVLSLKIVDRADKIEKLARKIKNSAKGL
ncbi:MAG TPA: hypothetical protein VFD30_01820 [Terriglobia bacterium]|nr:hypothetical protein [Terriglobia bacterium]